MRIATIPAPSIEGEDILLAGWGGGKREQREEENCTCQEHGREVCPSLGVGPKGGSVAFVFSLCSWLEVQKEADPTRKFARNVPNVDAITWQGSSASHFKGFELVEYRERWKFIRDKGEKEKKIRI